jgi:hypothetical protein
VKLDRHTCYRAMLARDRRFDGVFFVVVVPGQLPRRGLGGACATVA